MKCKVHGESDAVAVCVKCGCGLCEDCHVLLAGKNYCQNCADDLATLWEEDQDPYPVSKTRRKREYVSPDPPPRRTPDIETEKGLDLGEAIVICIFSPLAGAIAYLIWHNQKPKKAQEACIIALVMFVFLLIFYTIILF